MTTVAKSPVPPWALGKQIRVATHDNYLGCGFRGKLNLHDGMWRVIHDSPLFDWDTLQRHEPVRHKGVRFRDEDIAFIQSFDEGDGVETVRIQLKEGAETFTHWP